MDRKLTECKKNPVKRIVVNDSRIDESQPLVSKTISNDDSDGVTYERVQKLRNTRNAYCVTVVSKNQHFGAFRFWTGALLPVSDESRFPG